MRLCMCTCVCANVSICLREFVFAVRMCVCVCDIERVRTQLCVFVREFVFACYVISTCASARMREQIFVFVHTNAPTRPHACTHALEHNIADKCTSFARAHVQMQTCMYTWTRTQNRVQLNPCARAQIHIHIHACICAHLRARTRTCTQANPATTFFCKNAQICLCSRAHAHVHA